jgi:hypothetical protein
LILVWGSLATNDIVRVPFELFSYTIFFVNYNQDKPRNE